MEDKIKEAIEAIRPSLQNDGGDISLERIDGKNVHVKLHGHCAGCPMSQITLSNGVERYLRDTVDPELVVINDDFLNWLEIAIYYREGTYKRLPFFVSRETISIWHITKQE